LVSCNELWACGRCRDCRLDVCCLTSPKVVRLW
jgi:hypothetical protein